MRKFLKVLICFLCLFSNLAAAKHARDLDNNLIEFQDLKGKWVLINFWASWCEPCVNEISEFNKLYAKHSDKITVFAVNFDALSASEQKEIAKKYTIQYPNLMQSSMSELELGDIPVIPMTFIFNPQGRLATKLYGGQTLASLEKSINDLAQQ